LLDDGRIRTKNIRILGIRIPNTGRKDGGKARLKEKEEKKVVNEEKNSVY
jgi:hypothetical protein